MLPAAPPEVLANRIGLLVQACDATAGLIGNAVRHALGECPDRTAAWSTAAILAEVLRYDPPVRSTRRVGRAATELAGVAVPAGAGLLLRLDAANRDPAAFADPDRFDPARFDRVSPFASVLTLGYGARSCPGDRHGLALAAGVLDALRGRCRPTDTTVEYEPSPNLRIPRRLVVVLG